jgi:hydrogenase maturation protease
MRDIVSLPNLFCVRSVAALATGALAQKLRDVVSGTSDKEANMSIPRILIAGIGNIFLGDDGFGVEVVQRLARHPLPENVCVVDFGIRALDLMRALLHGYDAAILVETIQRGSAPGTVFVLEPPRPIPVGEIQPALSQDMLLESHGIDPTRLFRLISALGGDLHQIYILGCEPSPQAAEPAERQISPPVRRAIVAAIPTIESLICRISDTDNSSNRSTPLARYAGDWKNEHHRSSQPQH